MFFGEVQWSKPLGTVKMPTNNIKIWYGTGGPQWHNESGKIQVMCHKKVDVYMMCVHFRYVIPIPISIAISEWNADKT